MAEERFKIRQVKEEIPIWDLMVGEQEVGSLTDFPGEGPVATVHVLDEKITVGGDGMRLFDVVVAARDAYLKLIT